MVAALELACARLVGMRVGTGGQRGDEKAGEERGRRKALTDDVKTFKTLISVWGRPSALLVHSHEIT